jgi:hypothetical protein
LNANFDFLALLVGILLDTCSILVPKDVESYTLTTEGKFPSSTSKFLHFWPLSAELPMDTYSIHTCKDVGDPSLVYEGKLSLSSINYPISDPY